MSKKASLRWLQLALAIVLLFGSSLPAFAEVQEVNGVIAQVENDTGAPMQDGDVYLYAYMHYSSNGVQQYYTNQTFTTKVRNGEFFIPNAFILQGKQYDLDVRGVSSTGEAIVYHYSFIGGDISNLNFGKSQLKRLTFTHDKIASGNLLLMPTDMYGKTDKVSFPMYTRSFNEQGQTTAWIASNAEFKAYASLVTQGNTATYLLEANIPADVQSGQSISFGGETVKVTPPTGYENSGVGLGLQNMGSESQAQVGYVTKGVSGSVSFSVLKDNARYLFSRGDMSFTEDVTLQLDSAFRGTVPYSYSNGNGGYSLQTYYLDKYNNQLQFVDTVSASAFSMSMQEKGLWNETLGANGTPVRSALNSEGTSIEPSGSVQALNWDDPALEYQLSQNGTGLRTISGTRQISYPLQINNVSPGTYRLKLNRQLFPSTVVSLSLDQSIQIGQNSSAKSIGAQLPSGYTTSNLIRGAIIELDGSRVTASSTMSGGNLEFYNEINPQRQYRIVAAFLISSTTASPTASYLVDQTFTGEQMRSLQSLPVQSGLVRTIFSLEGTSITQMASVLLSLPLAPMNDQLSFSAPGVLLSAPLTLDASLIGTDSSTNAYHYNKSVTIPAQEQNIISFAELANSLITVELKNGQTTVPFEMVSVLKSNYTYSSSVPSSSITEENKLTKLYTTPGEYRFQFSQIKKADYETPWRYIWSSDRKVFSQATSLSFSEDMQGTFGPIQSYDYTNPDRTMLYTSAIIKAGDLSLNQVFVKQGSSYQAFSSAIIGKGPYDAGSYSYYNSVPATLTVKDLSGKVIMKSDSSYSDSVYADVPDKNGSYLLTYQLPIGPGQEIVISQSYSAGDPNAPPGKPDPKATFAGQGLKLTWEAVSGASYYDIYAAEQGQTLVKIKGNVTGTTFTYVEAQPGKTYDLKVVAVNGKGISTESSVIHFAVPAFAVSQLDVKASTVQSSAGFLKIGSQLPIELTGSIGEGISAKAVVSFKKTGTETFTEEVVLTPGQGKYTGAFEIKAGVTEVVSVKAFLTRNETNSDEKKVELNKKVGATLAGTIKQRDVAVTAKPVIEFIIDGQYVRANVDENGNFTAEGLPAGFVKSNVKSNTESYLDVIQGITTEFGVKQTGLIVKLPVVQNVKLRLVEQGTQVPVARALHVSITGAVNKEGYIGQDGYFVTYSGDTELKRLKPGSYTISITGDSLYEKKETTFNVDDVSDYMTNPVTISVAKKIKEIANVTLKLFMPEGAQTSQLESYYLSSYTAAQSFGWESGYVYGYNQSMTVSERVYVPNPALVLEGADPTVTQKVYGYYGTLTLPGIAAANDYTLNVSILGLQPVNKSQVSVATGTSTLEVALQPSVVYTGRIVDEAGRPVGGADVSAYAGSSYAYARTDADGAYRLDRLGETNQIQVSVHAVGFTDNTALQQVTDHQIPVITLENDQFIHGKVVDKDNRPLKYVSVFASNSKNSGWARTDADGYFKIRGLSAGTYNFTASLDGYPSYVSNLSTSSDQRTIVLQSQGGHFFGEGNSFAPSVATVVLGKEFSYSLKYKNNGTTPSGSTIWHFELPSNVKLVNGSVELNGKLVNATATNGVLEITSGDVIPGGSGEISFKALVEQADEAAIRTSVYPVVSGNKEEPTQIATSNVLYVTLNAPAVTGDKKIKVYGSTKPGSTVEIYAGSISLGRVTAEGRWWYADVVLPVAADTDEAELRLTAQVVENNQTQSSEAVNVKYKSGVPGIEEARITAGWNVDVKLNPKVSVATFAVTEKTPISTKVVFKEAVDQASISFIGSTYQLTKASDGKTFTGEVPYGWSSYGEQMLTLTYVKDGISVTVPLMEVIVLIDPSGYVFEGSMDNRVSGVTAVVQQQNNTQWSSWDADNYGQINPQTTDAEGRYGWDVMQGNWRVLFSKAGYEDYTSRTVVVPPAETQLNVPLVRTTTPEIASITPTNDAQNVNVSSNVDIVFDRPMDETSLNGNVIQLVKVDGEHKTAIDITFEYQHMKGYKEDLSLRDAQLLDGNNQSGWFIEDDSKKLSKKLTLKPRTALASGSTYQVIIKGSLLDYSGSNVLVADTSYTFNTETSKTPVVTGGGGGGGSSVASNEVELDYVMLNKTVANNEVIVALADKQDTLLVRGNVWNAIQSKGYTVKLQHKDAEVKIPAKAFVLKDDETLELVLQPSKVTYPAGYAASSQTLQVSLGKKNNGKKEELTTAEPLTLRLLAAPSNEPELLGAYEFINGMPNYLGREINVSFSASGTFGLAAFERKFTDVASHWAIQDIRYLVSHHIVDGITDTEFDPAGTTTRGQIAKLFAQMLQLKNSDTASSFSDVSADAWYADAVAAVEKAGIFQGANGQFRPDAAISRQELAVVISRLVKQANQTANKSFEDQTQIADWAIAGVNAAVNLGIIQGNEAGKFLPEANATRAEAAAMIHRLIQALDKE